MTYLLDECPCGDRCRHGVPLRRSCMACDDMERCTECGHQHWDYILRVYTECPVKGCECEGGPVLKFPNLPAIRGTGPVIVAKEVE